ncbi:MAG: hypothetical protein M0C28_12560 [Candidatus Moduliflexus flocculans]|nr:hypothetical protein [Candidatus Moduliflexus flocculans]
MRPWPRAWARRKSSGTSSSATSPTDIRPSRRPGASTSPGRSGSSGRSGRSSTSFPATAHFLCAVRLRQESDRRSPESEAAEGRSEGDRGRAGLRRGPRLPPRGQGRRRTSRR